MHELSICQSMLTQVGKIAVQHRARRVTQITLHVGLLSGVEPKLLLQAFTIASAGSVAQDASLVIESLPIRVHCRQCRQDSEATLNRLTCRHCGGHSTQLISGNELLLANVELATQ
jgi:hydrogenase nickel incorporation protein HypA/HybF